MSPEMREIEQAVAQEAVLLRGLPPALPDDALVARVRQSVQAEARRRRVGGRWVSRVALGASAAAAAVLVLSMIGQSARPSDVADQTLGDWAAAWDASNELLRHSLDDPWVDGGPMDDPESEADAWLESLERSLDRMHAL